MSADRKEAGFGPFESGDETVPEDQDPCALIEELTGEEVPAHVVKEVENGDFGPLQQHYEDCVVGGGRSNRRGARDFRAHLESQGKPVLPAVAKAAIGEEADEIEMTHDKMQAKARTWWRDWLRPGGGHQQ